MLTSAIVTVQLPAVRFSVNDNINFLIDENTFWAITNALQVSKLCNITSLFSIACGRHGCYAPQALVDLFKGEQQKNADFSIIKALISTHVDPEQGLFLIYDIICQYIIYLLERIDRKSTRLNSSHSS